MRSYLVISSNLQGVIKGLPGYEMDLGKNIMNAESAVFYDPLVRDHYAAHGRIIHQIGKISKLRFFVDYTMPVNDLMVCRGDKFYTEKCDFSLTQDPVGIIDNVLNNARSSFGLSDDQQTGGSHESSTEKSDSSISDVEKRKQILIEQRNKSRKDK